MTNLRSIRSHGGEGESICHLRAVLELNPVIVVDDLVEGRIHGAACSLRCKMETVAFLK